MSDTPKLLRLFDLYAANLLQGANAQAAIARDQFRAALAAQAEAHAKALEMAQAVAAADNTLHGAIDYWQNKAGELQATRDKPPVLVGNPIDTLLAEFNEYILEHGA
jgi:hypothetical protein